MDQNHPELAQNLHSMHNTLANNMLPADKNVFHTTLQENLPQQDNIPNINGDVFWNTNHCVSQPPVNLNCLDKGFEEELAKKHLVVVKVALYSYFSNLSQGQNYCHSENQTHSQYWQNEFDKQNYSNNTINKFIKNLRNSKQFKSSQLDFLQKILQINPICYKTFQIFSEGLSHTYKQKMFYLIFKTLEKLESFQQNDTTARDLFDFVEQTYLEMKLKPWLKENENNFNKFSKIIIYSALVYSLGKSSNKFYEQSLKKEEYKSMLTSKLWNCSKQPNLLSKNKNKKVVIRRRQVARS